MVKQNNTYEDVTFETVINIRRYFLTINRENTRETEQRRKHTRVHANAAEHCQH